MSDVCSGAFPIGAKDEFETQPQQRCLPSYYLYEIIDLLLNGCCRHMATVTDQENRLFDVLYPTVNSMHSVEEYLA